MGMIQQHLPNAGAEKPALVLVLKRKKETTKSTSNNPLCRVS